MQKLSIVGAGCIGRRIAQAVSESFLPYQIAAVCDIDADAAGRLIAEYAPEAQAAPLEQTVAASDVVVEAAAAGVVAEVLLAAQSEHNSNGRPGHVLIMSVGGLLGAPYPEPGGPFIHVPSGALGGLDAVQAMAVAGLDEVVLITRKPPKALDMDVDGETLVFEGAACDVIDKYPKNVNVAIALSFAGIGPDNTHVRLIADPAVTRNTHHVLARGPAGEVEFTSRNLPFPENPRTSYLAALSAISTLKRITDNLQVG